MDDLLFTVSHSYLFDELTTFLRTRLTLGEVHLVNDFLGCRIEQDLSNGTTAIHQSGYIAKFLSKFGVKQAKNAVTQLSSSIQQFYDTSARVCNIAEHAQYREIIGSLLWLSTWTRCRFQSTSHCTDHFSARLYYKCQAVVVLSIIGRLLTL